MIALPIADSHAPPIRVMALHALAYCPRLFYLEEVEEIRVADARVYAGRELHAGLEAEEGDEPTTLELTSDTLGLTGKVDCLRRRDGSYVPYEHKRGQPRRAEHPGTKQRRLAAGSLAFRIELEARLLEKEWTGEPGLFARSRLR